MENIPYAKMNTPNNITIFDSVPNFI